MRRISAPLTLAALLAVAAAGSAYVLSTPQRTVGAPLVITVDDTGLAAVADFDGGATAVAAALNSNEGWNGAGAGVILDAAVGDVSGHGFGDGNSDVFFTDPFGLCTGSCVVSTLTGYYSARPDGSYEIDEIDLVYNPSVAWTSTGEDPVPSGSCSGEIYVEETAVHQMGHGLGIAHTTVAGATMYPSVSSCTNAGASIEADDAAALVALYGAAPCTGCERYEDYTTAGTSFPPIPGGTTVGAGTVRGWIRGTAGTDLDLYLLEWNGSYWDLAASATGAGSSHEIAYTTGGGQILWYIVSNSSGSTGRYFFYQNLP